MFRRRENEPTGNEENGTSVSARGPLLPYYPPKAYLGQLDDAHQ